MKFIVISVLIVVALSNGLFADTVIDCTRPPGGEIRCPDTLAAICDVRSGSVYGQCIQPAKSHSLSDSKEFLSRIVGEAKYDMLQNKLSDDNIKRIIIKGEFKIDNSTIRFRLPQKMR